MIKIVGQQPAADKSNCYPLDWPGIEEYANRCSYVLARQRPVAILPSFLVN